MNNKTKFILSTILVMMEWGACVAMFDFSIQTVLYGILFSFVTVLAVQSIEPSVDSPMQEPTALT